MDRPVLSRILGLTWDEIDEAGGVIRIRARFAADWRLVAALARRDPNSPRVFHRNGIAIRRWRTAWRTAWQAAGVPTRFIHDCRRTAARNPPGPRRQAPRNVASILNAARELGIRDAQAHLITAHKHQN